MLSEFARFFVLRASFMLLVVLSKCQYRAIPASLVVLYHSPAMTELEQVQAMQSVLSHPAISSVLHLKVSLSAHFCHFTVCVCACVRVYCQDSNLCMNCSVMVRVESTKANFVSRKHQ